jgi:hypothetical protein
LEAQKYDTSELSQRVNTARFSIQLCGDPVATELSRIDSLSSRAKTLAFFDVCRRDATTSPWFMHTSLEVRWRRTKQLIAIRSAFEQKRFPSLNAFAICCAHAWNAV